uniref:Uncharacterized protein n=1 Tax=Neobodo designis TaxID=312471 RepID=A0A7S1W0S1_NEODS|mmetsp:Transcript_48272/g.148944  ORF Transcript_48272/g.148944 Transcript_48272/m.148944 type:complete len:293 (+) Transcript_48272:843-1721(+)
MLDEEYESVKKDLAHAKAQLAAATTFDEQKMWCDQIVAWNNRLIAIDNRLAAAAQAAEHITDGYITDTEQANRIVTSVWLRSDVKGGGGGATPIKCFVDLGCPYPLVLSPATFDEVVASLGVPVQKLYGRYPQQARVEISLDGTTFDFVIQALKDSSRGHGNLLGLPALALLRYSVDCTQKCLVKRCVPTGEEVLRVRSWQPDGTVKVTNELPAGVFEMVVTRDASPAAHASLTSNDDTNSAGAFGGYSTTVCSTPRAEPAGGPPSAAQLLQVSGEAFWRLLQECKAPPTGA